jgi:beta-lactamase superfamily II metal-dependent hydrolase
VDVIPVSTFIYNGGAGTSTWNDTLAYVQGKGIPTQIARAGSSFSVGNVTINVLAPPQAFVILPTETHTNENSTVMQVSNASGVRFFFGGDVENEGVTSLLAQGYDLRSSVMLTPHHGSKNGLTQALYDAIRPDTVIISVGPNSYGHPTAEVLGIIATRPVSLYRTDERGNIIVRVTGTTYTVETEK